MTNLFIIGSGVTGSATSYLLKQKFPFMNITVLEKAKSEGGRMCTSRSPYDKACTADLGAQYITKTKKLTEFQKKCYEVLIEAGLLKPMCNEIEGMQKHEQISENYVCPKGSGSVVKHFIENSDCKIYFGQKVVQITPSSDDRQWITKTENSVEKRSDIIISTIPVPQLLQIHMKFAIGNDLLTNLRRVKYNSRFAVGCYYDKTKSLNVYPFTARYVTDSSSIRFLSFDHKKRGVSTTAPSLVIHSTKEFGKKYLENNISDAAADLMCEMKRLFLSIPTTETFKCIKWRFAQVEVPYPNRPGCIILSEKPLFICGGDGFTNSTFQECLLSAETIVKTLANETGQFQFLSDKRHPL